MTIHVSRSTILNNRRDMRDDPAWILRRDDGTETRCRFADFGSFRLVQKPVKTEGSICYIETEDGPHSVSV